MKLKTNKEIMVIEQIGGEDALRQRLAVVKSRIEESEEEVVKFERKCSHVYDSIEWM